MGCLHAGTRVPSTAGCEKPLTCLPGSALHFSAQLFGSTRRKAHLCPHAACWTPDCMQGVGHAIACASEARQQLAAGCAADARGNEQQLSISWPGQSSALINSVLPTKQVIKGQVLRSCQRLTACAVGSSQQLQMSCSRRSPACSGEGCRRPSGRCQSVAYITYVPKRIRSRSLVPLLHVVQNCHQKRSASTTVHTGNSQSG